MYVPSPTEKDPQKIARGVRGAAELFASGQFVVLENSTELGNERKLTAGDGITLTDGGAGGNVIVAFDSSVLPEPPPDVSAAQFVTLAATGDLGNERVLTAGNGVTLTDGGAGNAATVAVSTTQGGGGTYALARNVSGSTVTQGNTVAGSNLRIGTFSTASSWSDGSALSGTWRNMSEDCANERVSLWARTS